jgi:hypothetical protein
MANNKIDSGGISVSNVANGLVDNLTSNVSGIFSLKPMAKYLSGARCVLRLNGKIVGFAFNISWKISTAVTEIMTIDDYFPHELAPSRISVSGTISGFRIPGSGPTQQLLQADALSFLHQRYIQIEVRDTQTDNLIFLTKHALVTSRSENISTSALATMKLDFKAIGWVDEKTPELPEGIGSTVDDQQAGVTESIQKATPSLPDVKQIAKQKIKSKIPSISVPKPRPPKIKGVQDISSILK